MRCQNGSPLLLLKIRCCISLPEKKTRLEKLPEWIQDKIRNQVKTDRQVEYSDGDLGITDSDLPESMLDDDERIPF